MTYKGDKNMIKSLIKLFISVALALGFLSIMSSSNHCFVSDTEEYICRNKTYPKI